MPMEQAEAEPMQPGNSMIDPAQFASWLKENFGVKDKTCQELKGLLDDAILGDDISERLDTITARLCETWASAAQRTTNKQKESRRQVEGFPAKAVCESSCRSRRI